MYYLVLTYDLCIMYYLLLTFDLCIMYYLLLTYDLCITYCLLFAYDLRIVYYLLLTYDLCIMYYLLLAYDLCIMYFLLLAWLMHNVLFTTCIWLVHNIFFTAYIRLVHSVSFTTYIWLMHKHNVTVVCIKNGGRTKALCIHLYVYTHIYTPQNVYREITTSTQGNGSDQLLYRGLYSSTYQQTNYEEPRITGSQACWNSILRCSDIECERKTIPAFKPIYILCLLLPIACYILCACYLCITCAPIIIIRCIAYLCIILGVLRHNFVSAKKERSVGIERCEVKCDNKDVKRTWSCVCR